ESLRPHFPARIGQARSGRYGAVVPFLLLLVQAGLIAGLAWQSSINRTETGHVGAAIYLYRTGRFDVFAVNPPLTRAIVGGAIALFSSEYDWKSCSLRSQPRPEWTIGSYFVKANSPTKIRWVIFHARCSLIPIVLIGGYFGPLMEFDFASETLSGAREREGTRVNATGNRFRDSWLGYVPMPLPADM
ncbi:MAG: hypothetical protein GY854_01635, partial [Deltaproteobacteria bacterium]|nr:hypothetical protein [Deltaproteobacteria bacterium]